MSDRLPTYRFIAVFMSIFFLAFSDAYGANSDIDFLKKLVEINSGSKNIAGVKAVQTQVEIKLKQLGFSTSYIENPKGQSAPMLVAVLKGRRSDRYITLITHADTVFEPESGFLKFSESADGSQLLGPGIGDDKGGIVIALSGLQQLLQGASELPYSLRVVVSPNEEVGSPGYEDTFKSFSKDSIMALGFEDALADGALAQSRSAIAKYTIKVSGREAHSGTNHEDGVNACVELSKKLLELSNLTNYREGTTVNVAWVSGGSEKTNIVCGSAEAKVEVRFTTPDHMKSIQPKIEKILKRVNIRSVAGHIPTTTEYSVQTGRPPFAVNKASLPFISKYQNILSKLENRTIDSRHMGGSADISYMANMDLIAIDDLGAIGGAAHTKEEHILASSIVTRAQAFAEFMRWSLPKLNGI